MSAKQCVILLYLMLTTPVPWVWRRACKNIMQNVNMKHTIIKREDKVVKISTLTVSAGCPAMTPAHPVYQHENWITSKWLIVTHVLKWCEMYDCTCITRFWLPANHPAIKSGTDSPILTERSVAKGVDVTTNQWTPYRPSLLCFLQPFTCACMWCMIESPNSQWQSIEQSNYHKTSGSCLARCP